jgi:putative DNA primase/helicase
MSARNPHANYSTLNIGGHQHSNGHGDRSLDIREGDTFNGYLVPPTNLSTRGQQTPGSTSNQSTTQQPHQGSLAVRTVASLQAVLPQTRWLWKDWLPRGYLTMLAGVPGVGKSALALHLAGQVLEQGTWPDGTVPDLAGNELVCWVDTEASQALLVDRCEKWDLTTGRIAIPTPDGDPLTDIRLDDVLGWAALEECVRRTKSPLVVLDSLRGSYRGDENSSDLIDLMSKLAALARDNACSVLVLHHLRKANSFESLSEITLDRIRGSSAIVAMCRVVWALDTPDTDHPERMRLSVIKSNLGLKPAPIGITWQDDQIVVCDAPLAPVHETQESRAMDILRAYLTGQPRRAVDVFEELKQAGISAPTVNRAKKKLNVVATKHKDGWWWSLPITDEPLP